MIKPASQIAFDFFQTAQNTPDPETGAEKQEGRNGWENVNDQQKEENNSGDNHILNQVEDETIATIAGNQQLSENGKDHHAASDQEIAEKIQEPASVAFISPVKSTRGRKSQKTFAAEADRVNIPVDELLFQRQYYSIGEVSTMFGVNASLLRFWESEFSIIQPKKNRKGDRHFRPVDIKNLQLIYDLLRRRKLTIEGAKEFLKNNKKSQERFEMIRSLQNIRSFLLEIKSSL